MGDLISRQAAIKAIGTVPDYDDGMVFEALSHAQRDVALLSPEQQWIPCSKRLPYDCQWYYATCKSLIDNRENWVIEGCYTPWERFNSTPMIRRGEAEVIAWMPKEFPEPWGGEQDG